MLIFNVKIFLDFNTGFGETEDIQKYWQEIKIIYS